ncbi:hypothetical protein G7Y89_g9504 [Cudoniella acicularis]|uniref:Heterokaryon incompatibility domain-containing protein n=1 Tax=Cudoniella acicularis TaxID=354080 RepID=A0A8H4RI78_9HELO|nr:hypothetical protein G7Y89_g9504 [Cudoniella acicularis]
MLCQFCANLDFDRLTGQSELSSSSSATSSSPTSPASPTSSSAGSSDSQSNNRRYSWLLHHSSYTDLVASAESKCQLCAIVDAQILGQNKPQGLEKKEIFMEKEQGRSTEETQIFCNYEKKWTELTWWQPGIEDRLEDSEINMTLWPNSFPPGRSIRMLPHLTTTRDNVEVYQQGIPLVRLPETIRDAVYVTRNLGIRYLWVDALCIIQDDPNDWAQETGIMGNIYKNAVVTVIAEASPDSNARIFSPANQVRHPILSSTIQVPCFPKIRAIRPTDVKGKIPTWSWASVEFSDDISEALKNPYYGRKTTIYDDPYNINLLTSEITIQETSGLPLFDILGPLLVICQCQVPPPFLDCYALTPAGSTPAAPENEQHMFLPEMRVMITAEKRRDSVKHQPFLFTSSLPSAACTCTEPGHEKLRYVQAQQYLSQSLFDKDKLTIMALVLKKVGEGDRYERVGLAVLRDDVGVDWMRERVLVC